ncbi:hypothetical protein MMC34_000059 [Xylographa carneopallida]|nr:hypothetical protein [Xylographa carneopallida]
MTQRLPLKLKLTTSTNPSGTPGSPHPLATPSSASGMPKLKIRFGSSAAASSDRSASTSAANPPARDKKELKSSLKKAKKEKLPRLSTGRKRDHGVANIDEEPTELLPLSSPAPLTGSSSKRIKLITKAPATKTPTTPFIRLKPKGKLPIRPLGVGYDSEASDREEDPAIEEEFILRMLPGDDCEYLRKAIEEKRWGPKSQGGADVRLKFLHHHGRRAVITICGRIYAATLVDLPCVIEGMKSWDKRGWWKTADICQMLLVLGIVKTESEALNYPLPGRELDKTTWQYAHGLTPPMRWVRKRRFRKRVSNRTIEAVEDEVERLLRLDEECIGESKYENLDLDRLSKTHSGRGESADEIGGESVYEEQDAEGEVDDGGGYFDQRADQEEMDDDGLAADLELAMMASDADDTASAATPAGSGNAVALDTLQQTDSEAGTPAANTPSKDDSGDDESDEDAEVEEEIDEDVLEQQADLQRQREEIADLEAAIKSQTAEYERQSNIILKKKILGKIQSLKGDLELKLAAIGEGGDD